MTKPKHLGANIYNMKLHEKVDIKYRTEEDTYDHGMLEIIRVPGGWLYRRNWSNGDNYGPMTFVPYDNQFLKLYYHDLSHSSQQQG